MNNPGSTYRIQFNKDFTFSDFLNISRYLSELGVSSIYASPVFNATPGSTHGYDVTNSLEINPEIGTIKEFYKISDFLKKNALGWVQDIVPNHMAFHNNNEWLMDVLARGKGSEYSKFFDIDFSHPEYEGKVMVPFLGKTLQDAVNDNEIILSLKDGKPVFTYFDSWFPLNEESVKEIGNLSQKRLDELNSDKNSLNQLLDFQRYKLCYWKDSLSTINYRRFFTVNSLICLRMEDDEVFEKHHSFIKEQVDRKRFTGLRIDHVDGLNKPAKYLDKLRLLAGGETYIVTEKILGLEEELPLNLPIQGTSGYDYLGIVNNVFTRSENYPLLRNFYLEITGVLKEPEELIYESKKMILNGSMGGEWENLTRMFEDSGFINYNQLITRESIKQAIGEFLILFPVYKIYGDTFPLPSNESRIVSEVFAKARERNPSLAKSLDVLRNIFLDPDADNVIIREKALKFFLRCLQFTGPLMAKGVEDTVMYNYNCFIAHNEVGDHSASEGISAERYHVLMQSRQRHWPMSMNGTSTHDTKRGEDVRARLNVISEIPEEWIENVKNWMVINASYKSAVKGITAPDPNEEYFIYQTLAGCFPFDGKVDDELLERLDQYLEKSLREAKKNSDWNEVNEEHEKAVKEFTRSILAKNSEFLKSFIPLQRKIAAFGVINSLSQLVLKSTSPGIPDFYQGTELWDLSLVDPDNRRPVDYSKRKKFLKSLLKAEKNDPEKLLRSLYKKPADGRIKLWLSHLLLREIKSNPDLFLHGSYIPLKVRGKLSANIMAYARVHKKSWFITVIPLFPASIAPRKREPGKIRWGDTEIILPELAPSRWSSPLKKGEVRTKDSIKIADLMDYPMPVFVTGQHQETARFAGVLAHITSLPGRFGTGDLGDDAYKFTDVLQQNGQAYWQILPFNPVDGSFGWSPYSSISAFAGSTLILSPLLLERAGLINAASLNKTDFLKGSGADFAKALKFREMLSDEAFTSFFCQERPYLHSEFERFCRQQQFWLDDFALFTILKREHNDLPWNEWPQKYRDRDAVSLRDLSDRYHNDLKKEKFMQYIFNSQWLALKKYCNNKGIKIIGDMSFYVNYDSAELWAHPEYFKLDSKNRPVTVAGVPPDYFSKTGQLWNMPVYDWKRMKKDKYAWWINRIRRNMELCDILRFDHFRAFSAYWEVPYGEKTAVNGKWTDGPDHDFFERVKKEYPGMPFIAEDLGSIDDKVLKLRDDFCLPGMVILQFAFGDDTPKSAYIPHNYNPWCVVYTGTHDNNTTRGWFSKELDQHGKDEASEYTGHKIDKKTCHEDFVRLAYSSVARFAIIPVQDLLGLDESARFNKPSSSLNNWMWRMGENDMEEIFSPKIRRMIKLYGRI